MSSPSSYPRFLPVGDAALTVEFGDIVSPELNDKVVALDIAVNAAELEGVVETVPTYRSLLVFYDPLETTLRQLVAELRALLERGSQVRPGGAVTWSVPVVYDPPYADDLPEVAERLRLTEEQVISTHMEPEYQVYMVGYTPGMPYLGIVPPALHISRRQTPRPSVPAGAIMIGGVQAGIIPTSVPSAWYTLGQTPLRGFDPDRPDPFLFRTGDRVRFHRIEDAEFRRLAALTLDDLLPLVRGSA